MIRQEPRRELSMTIARAILRIATCGEESHISVSCGTGTSDGIPLSGSRIMPLANELAAEFGFPGRTEIVGRRQMRASINPLRLYSLTRISQMALVAP